MIRHSSNALNRILTKRNPLQSCATFSSSKDSSPNQKLYSDLNRRIEKYQRELWKHARASFKHRELNSSIQNLQQTIVDMKTKEEKVAAKASTSTDLSMLVPSQVTIEVLSNGTAHMKPSVAIKTPHNVYLFNCPEGASRFIADLRIRSTNIRDIFITKNSWENIGGISSILLSKGKETFSTKLHGPYRVKDYLDCIRPFADADFNVPKYPNRVDEQTYDMEKYEDHALTVRYLPLTDFSTRPALDPLSVSPTDVAFLVTLKEAQRRINPVKLINLKVPNGPLIAKLKAGESVTIPDGRLIHPDDVLSDREEDRPHVLIVELDDIRKLPSLKENTCLQPFTSNKTQMNFVVHFTRDDVLNKPDYQTWLKSFGPQCRHVVANGSGKCLPHMESMYRNQILLNNIDEGFFPLLTPTSFNDVHGQDCPDDAGKQVVVAKPMQRFAMRGEMNTVDPVLIDLRRNELLAKNFESPEISAALEKYKRESSEVSKDEPFPRISFLGTSSAVPSKYRNVSSYLMELSDKAAIMVDCGEGTYGQLRVLYGDRHAEILANLKAIFVTHAHQDHMNGLYSLIIERHRIYQNLNRPYVPLIVVCNRNVKSPMTMFSRCFYNVESLVSTVDVTHRLPSKNSNVDRDKSFFISNITDRLPVDLYDAKEWNLQSAVSVHVHHTRMANGFIFTDNQGKKVVFSGDTMPCDLLAETGRGADILVHEATFGDDHEDSARKKKHSTMLQAITVGEKMKAKHVLLSHFSARYPKVPWLPEYLDERGNVAVAMDNFVVPFGRLPATSKLIPAYRELFKEDLFEIEVKQNQRRFRNEEDKEENGPAAKRRNLVGAERV